MSAGRLPAAVTFDYWDTLYEGAALLERVALRRAALWHLLSVVGAEVPEERFVQVYRASAAEADRWWREEHRGYTTEERIRWMLEQLDIQRPEGCEHVARACEAVDDALVAYPPPLLPGAAEAVRALAARMPLAIISDTGFASGRAQDRLLERDGLVDCFPVRVYSMDIGHAKPRPEPFLLAVRTLGVEPAEALHVGDIERTDVLGALGAGLRAIRSDVARQSGASQAELVVSSYAQLLDYLAEP